MHPVNAIRTLADSRPPPCWSHSPRLSLLVLANCTRILACAIRRPSSLLGRSDPVLNQSCICLLVHPSRFFDRRRPRPPGMAQTCTNCHCMCCWRSCVAARRRCAVASTRADLHARDAGLRCAAGVRSCGLRQGWHLLTSFHGSRCVRALRLCQMRCEM